MSADIIVRDASVIDGTGSPDRHCMVAPDEVSLNTGVHLGARIVYPVPIRIRRTPTTY